MQVSDFQCIRPFGLRGKWPPDHQHVSSSPSEIPYDGFSPVRLQAGSPLRPSAPLTGSSARPAYTSHPGPLYAVQARFASPSGPPRSAVPCETHRMRPCGQAALGSVRRALQPRGPSLSRRLCCPAGSPLLWPHLRLSAPPAGLSSSSRRVSCPSGSSGRGAERVPNLLRMSVPLVPSPVPRWTPSLRTAVASRRTLAFAFFAQARHPQPSARRFPRWSCNEVAEFASCYGPRGSQARHRHGPVHPSFRPSGSPPKNVGYDYMANSQFP